MGKRRWPWVLGGVALLVGAATTAGVLYLDGLLLERARAEAAKLSSRWGREVSVGGISTRLLPRLGVVVVDVAVGPGPGEPEPLATLPRAEIAIPVLPVLRSRGRDVPVSKVEVAGLAVNVIRLDDGTSNVSRLLERIQASPPEEKKEEAAEEKPTDLSAIQVDLAELSGARIRFVDLGAGTRKELEVSQLDVKVKDLRAGQPLVVELSAAVFADRRNLEVELRAAPLPPSLVPTPERVSIRAGGVDLAPLGPFLGEAVGLERGTLEAEWSAELGAAVAGGQGPTRLAGTLRLSGLRFSGAEVSRPLDVVVETDVQGDVAAGDLRLDKLDVAAGPLVARGKGRVQGLLSEAPRIEGLEISIPRLDPAELAAFVPALKRALGDRVAGPATLSIRASGTTAAPSIELSADLTPMRLSVPGQLSKGAGAPMKLAATLSGAKRALRFQAEADLSGVDLRPGEDIDKAPGQALSAFARGTFAREGGETHVELEALRLDVLEQRVSGTARVALTATTTTVSADLQSARLDLDELLHEAPAPAPPKDPHRFDGLRIDATVKAGALRVEKVDMENVLLQISMVDDMLTVKRLSAGVYGGKVVGDGTHIRLGPSQRPFHAALEIQGVDVGKALAARTDKKFLAGRFTGEVAVDGVGTKMAALSQSMAGVIAGNLNDGRLLGTDVMSGATALLARALPFAARALESNGLTDLGKELPFSVTVDKGVARLKRPISLTRPEGALSLEGGARLDGTLDLAGTLQLAPEAVARMTRGKVTPHEPFPIPVKISGPAWKPVLSITDLHKLAGALARMAAAEGATRILGDRARPVADALEGGEEKIKQEAAARQKDLEERAAQERARAEAAAREQAEKAKKRLEEEAKKRLQDIFGK